MLGAAASRKETHRNEKNSPHFLGNLCNGPFLAAARTAARKRCSPSSRSSTSSIDSFGLTGFVLGLVPPWGLIAMSAVSAVIGKVVTAKTRYTTSRRGPANTRAADKRHAQHIGEVVHAWNRAHAGLFWIFLRVAADSNYELAIGMWHALPTDKAQRLLLESIVTVKLRNKKSLQNAALWAIAVMTELSTYRNDAAHAEMLHYYDELEPGLRMEPGASTKPGSAKRLTDRPLDQSWRQLRGDLHAIADYLAQLDQSLWFGWPRPSCRRPRLQFSRSNTELSQAKRRRAKQATRERQRQSSHP